MVKNGLMAQVDAIEVAQRQNGPGIGRLREGIEVIQNLHSASRRRSLEVAYQTIVIGRLLYQCLVGVAIKKPPGPMGLPPITPIASISASVAASAKCP
jgi:hypothetical protein